MKRKLFTTYTQSLHTKWRQLALLVALAVTSLAAGLAVAPTTAHAVAVEGSWSCTVPSGWVWSAVRSDASCSGKISHRLTRPAEGNWVCRIPIAWSYDDLSSDPLYGPCQLGFSRGKAVHSVIPRAGRTVCELPKNNKWAYYGTSSDPSRTACRLGGANGVTGITLITPATNVWACNVPAGFTYTQTQLFKGPGRNPCLGSLSYLLKKI